MAYIITPLGMKLADPLTVQAFETVVVNANFLTLEEAIGVEKLRIDGFSDGAARGTRATYFVTDLDGIDAISNEVEGDLCYVDEGNFYLQRDDAIWVQLTPATFVDAAARDAAFAKASAAYLVPGAQARIGTDVAEYWMAGTPPVGSWRVTKFRPRRVHLFGAGNPSITTGGTLIPLTSAGEGAIADPDMHSDTVNPTRITIPEDGVYRVSGRTYVNSATGSVDLLPGKNGTNILRYRGYSAGAAGAGPHPFFDFEERFAKNDYVSMMATGSTTFTGLGAQTFLTVERVE